VAGRYEAWGRGPRLGLALAVLALAGCGGTKIDDSKVERLLEGKAPTGGATVTSAQCPSGVEAKADSSFDCKVKMSDGTTGTWPVNIVSSKGEIIARGQDFSSNEPALKSGASEVGKTKRLPAAHGTRLRVTVLGYKPDVGPVSDDALAHVATVTLRIVNPSSNAFRDDPLADLTVLRNANGTGDSSDDAKTTGSQPCDHSFWARKLNLAPGAATKGCVPYKVGNGGRVVDFSFGTSGMRLTHWKLG
jgi:hypothetical protein